MPTSLFTATLNGGQMITDEVMVADKFSTAAKKAREIVELNHLPDMSRKLAENFDALLGFLLSQFRVESSAEQIREVICHNNSFSALNGSELSELPEGVVPVAVVKELIANHQIEVDPRKFSNWEMFLKRYDAQILYA
jgi:DNA-directed RNA polymerase subunit F